MLERAAIFSQLFLIFSIWKNIFKFPNSRQSIKNEKDKKNIRKALTKYKRFGIIGNGKKGKIQFLLGLGFFQ